MSNTSLQDLAAKWLKDNGYDGLYLDNDCGCSNGDLMPCGDPNPGCAAGYEWSQKQARDEGVDFDPDMAFMIHTRKPKGSHANA